LSKQIVEAMGGRIWFVSEPGRGSTFSFSLPLLDLTAKGPSAAA
jgi:signal transduction histidine kinase